MRIRSIKPDFFKDEELAALDPLARLLFIGLWQLADSEGRLEDRPVRIKAEVLPYDACDVDAFMDDLHAGDFITRYTVAGQDLILVRQFRKHQRLSGAEAARESEYPAPDHPEAIEKQSRSNGEAFEKRSLLQSRKHSRSTGEAVNVQERKGRGIGKERKGTVSSSRDEGGFEEFWSAYPRKIGKGSAGKAWKALSPDDRAAALSGVGDFAAAWDGKPAEEHQFCPHPTTWLHQRRWEDDRAEWQCRRGDPRNGTRQPALIGAHPYRPPRKQREDQRPAWVTEVHRRMTNREPLSDAALDAAIAWEDGENPAEPATLEPGPEEA